MKQHSLLALTLVLTAALFTGCGCTNQRMDNTSAPTVLPTNEENWTTGASQSTTEGASASRETDATQDNGMIGGGDTTDNGNGPLENDTTSSTGSTGSTGGASESTTQPTTR